MCQLNNIIMLSTFFYFSDIFCMCYCLYYLQVEQYHNAIFYGPSGTSKTFIARRLAHCIQVWMENSM